MLSYFRLSLAVLVLGACSEPTRGCDVCTYSALIYGTVTNSAGAPVVGGSVRAYSTFQRCDAADAFDVVTVVSSGVGAYRMQVKSPVQDPPCVRVEVASTVATAPQVHFKLTADASLPYDSVRVDIRLP